jgi:ADP-heptose:LPS heptosyltransferase
VTSGRSPAPSGKAQAGTPRILVIKLGALGDFVQAMGPAAAIRAHHAGARITLLTTAPFAELARRCPYFDEVWIDERPGLFAFRGLFELRRRLRGTGFTRIYDLQTSDRSNSYFRLLLPGKRPEWSGIAKGASHPHDNPARDRLHTIDRQVDQLRRAGITDVPPPDLGWAASDIARFALPETIVVLVPGGAAHRLEKRWPIGRYGALAAGIAAAGATPVVIGGPGEAPLGAAIAATCPAARDLTGQTGFGDIVALGKTARRAIGNDTGPMHLLVAAGCPATVLYSAASDPDLTAPRGRDVTVLRRPALADLSVEEVAATLGIG